MRAVKSSGLDDIGGRNSWQGQLMDDWVLRVFWDPPAIIGLNTEVRGRDRRPLVPWNHCWGSESPNGQGNATCSPRDQLATEEPRSEVKHLCEELAAELQGEVGCLPTPLCSAYPFQLTIGWPLHSH